VTNSTAPEPAPIDLQCAFAELVELAVLDPVQQRRDQQLRIPQAQPLGLAELPSSLRDRMLPRSQIIGTRPV
jgi:hypothetical protein